MSFFKFSIILSLSCILFSSFLTGANNFLENGGELKDAYYVDQTPFSHLHTFDELAARNAGRVYEEMEFE